MSLHLSPGVMAGSDIALRHLSAYHYLQEILADSDVCRPAFSQSAFYKLIADRFADALKQAGASYSAQKWSLVSLDETHFIELDSIEINGARTLLSLLKAEVADDRALFHRLGRALEKAALDEALRRLVGALEAFVAASVRPPQDRPLAPSSGRGRGW